MDEQQNTNMSQPSGSSSGPVIGVIVILVVIILAGLYFWGQRGGAEDVNTDQAAEAITTQSDSDDTNSIENDLNNTDIENIDSEINAS